VTALTIERMRDPERWQRKEFLLASGNIAFKNGIACGDLSTGKVEPGHEETDLLMLGVFAESANATAGDVLVNVDLIREIEVEWWANATAGDAVVATDVFNLCYVLDDQTVTRTPTGHSVAGRVWAVHATKGVAVEKLQAVPTPSSSLDGLEAVETALAAFSSNNINVGASPNSGSIYDVPATAAASTISLPATAAEGTVLYFVADGTKNGHTVQYRDITGPVNLTTALTASKRHLVIATYLNGIWNANAYVSP
jgi:hypothetical protein